MKKTIWNLLMASLMAYAAQQAIAAQGAVPGSYVTERGWGTLVISKPDGKGVSQFKINAIGGNNHTCEVEGTLRGNRGTAEHQCVIDVVAKDGWLQVSVPKAATEACRGFCGTRAQFEGEYFVEDTACRPAEVAKRRNQFSQRYKAKDYPKAIETLGSIMENCGRFLPRQVEVEVVNDMAVTYKNMNEKGSCLGVLQPLKKDFVDEPGATFSPADQAWGERMIKATRFNWKSCGGG